MAGAEFKKYSGSSFGEMSHHFDNEIRGDENTIHSNLTINKELTYKNYYVGAADYQEIVERTNELISEADATSPPKRVRKDRKVSFSLEVKCPPELEGTDQEDIFYQKVFDMYKESLPGLVGGVVHKDEKHPYLDSKKGDWVISRNHIHLLGACLTEDGRINAHDLLTKEMCQKVNDDIQALCLSEWGISYQTGEGRQGAKKTVEQLKSESAVKLQEKLAKEGLDVVCAMRQEKDTLQGEIADLKLVKQADTREIQNLDKQVEEKTAELDQMRAEKAEYDAFIQKDHDYKDYKPVLGKKGFRAVPERDVDIFCAATDDVKQKDKQLKDKDTAYDALHEKYENEQGARYRAERQRDRYKGYKEDRDKMIADFQKRLNKVKKSPFKDPSEMSHLIHEYAVINTLSDKERAAILKACEALDKLDRYTDKLEDRLPSFTLLDDEADELSFKVTAIRETIKAEYMKILDYGGRKEMYDDISALWESSKSVSTEIYKKYGKKASSVQSLQAKYTPIITGILSDLLSLVRMAFELIQEASYGYGR